MKKQILKLFIVGFTVLAMFSSCNKDNVSQEDVIVNQQLIDLAIRIVDASNNDMPLDSALVEIVSGDKILSAATDETGLVFFSDVTVAYSTPITITKTGFTTIASEMYIYPEEYRIKQITEKFRLYPSSGDNMVTVEGTLSIESDVTNREREAVPAGLIVRAFNNSLYTNIAFIGETNANGEYSIQVPVSYTGTDDIQLQYPEIYTNQTVAIQNEEDYTISVVERPAYFELSKSSIYDSVPSVPSAYAVIDAPPANNGTNFSLGIKANRISLNTGSTSTRSSVQLINGGSGYSNGNDQYLTFSPDPSGNSAQLQVDIENGHIIRIDNIINNSATYSSPPTINPEQLGGSGAEFNVQFQGSYNIYISNNGSGYTNFPEVFYDYEDYSNNILRTLTAELNLSSYCNLINGKITNKTLTNVDTIATFSSIATAPVFTIIDKPSEQILVEFLPEHIDDDGKLTDYDEINDGIGYNPINPPSITVNTVAGYGSGAELRVELTSNGELTNIEFVNQGTNYVKNVNDFNNDGNIKKGAESPSFSYGSNYDGFRQITDALPGSTYIRSAHYGTGSPVEDF